MKELMAIGPIMVALMEKRSVETGNNRLEDPQPWSREIIEFLSLMDSPSYKQLTMVTSLKNVRVYR